MHLFYQKCCAGLTMLNTNMSAEMAKLMVVAKGDAREVGDRELELFQICQSSKFF